MKSVSITLEQLAEIIGAVYYGEDEDLEHTEDLIDYLQENGRNVVWVNVKEESK